MADGESIIPFGKYKGKTIEDIPSDYLDYLLSEEWFETKFKDLYEEVKQEMKFRNDFDKHFYGDAY
jgi:uncharacterized protein (DUF3820 family)